MCLSDIYRTPAVCMQAWGAGLQWGITPMCPLIGGPHTCLSQLLEAGTAFVRLLCGVLLALSPSRPGTETCPGDTAGEVDLGSLISVGLCTVKAPECIPKHSLTVLSPDNDLEKWLE